MGAGREVAISLDGLRDKNLMQLKKLNIALFPVRYNDKYYADALSSGEFSKLGMILFWVIHFLLNLLLFVSWIRCHLWTFNGFLIHKKKSTLFY